MRLGLGREELCWPHRNASCPVSRRKREERLRKVLQTRERAEQIEEERKRRIEQKIALSEEKTEKVRPRVLELVGLCLQPWAGRFPAHPGEHRLHAAARGTRKRVGRVGCATALSALGSSSNGSSSASKPAALTSGRTSRRPRWPLLVSALR